MLVSRASWPGQAPIRGLLLWHFAYSVCSLFLRTACRNWGQDSVQKNKEV